MTTPVPGRRYRAGDVEGKWHPYDQPARYAGRLVLDDGSSVIIAPGLQRHLTPVEPTERRVVLTCGRSQIHGVLDKNTSGAYWYVRVDGEPSRWSLGKAEWTLADEPTEPSEVVVTGVSGAYAPTCTCCGKQVRVEPDLLLCDDCDSHKQVLTPCPSAPSEAEPQTAADPASPEPEPIPDREGVVVLDRDGDVWQRRSRERWSSVAAASRRLDELAGRFGPLTLLHDPEHPHACRVEPVAVDVEGLAQVIADSDDGDWEELDPHEKYMYRNNARAVLRHLAGQGVPVVAKDQP